MKAGTLSVLSIVEEIKVGHMVGIEIITEEGRHNDLVNRLTCRV
jgi:hypothetical protein